MANLSYCEIRSPVDGIVIRRNVDVGNSVAASLCSPTLFEIGNDLTKMQIVAAVAEADIGIVALGQDATFTVDAYPNFQFHGEVVQVRNAPITYQNVVTYGVIISVNNNDLKLKPGMTAEVSIVIARRTKVVEVANSALVFRLPDTLAAYVKPLPVTSSVATKEPLSPAERRRRLDQLLREVGYTGGRGQPSPDLLRRVQALAKERGIELPEQFAIRSANVPVYRVVYRLPDGDPDARPEAVSVRLGITDGASTEILSGLKEGDVVITGVNRTGASHSSPVSRGFGRS